MNQNEYEELFREDENAQSEAATCEPGENQKVPEQNQSTTESENNPLIGDAHFVQICTNDLNPTLTDRIYMGLSDVAFSAIRHKKFWDIAYHLEKIREILEGEE